MAMRMTGIVSGMDTESIIKELVKVKQTKVDDAKKAQTKLQWQQDAWKSFNTKIKALQTKYINNMRFSTGYTKKTTTVSNSSLVSVITGENAMNGVQDLEISRLAKTGFLTGSKLNGSAGKLTALSKMSEIEGSTVTDGSVINVTVNGEMKNITVNADSTISDVLTQFKKVGLNANFDATNQRLFISSKDSGSAQNFAVTVSDEAGESVLSALGINVNLSQDKAALAEYQRFSGYYVAGDRTVTIANMQTVLDKEAENRTNGYLGMYKDLKNSIQTSQEKIKKINDKYKDDPLKTSAEYKSDLDAKNAEISELKKSMADMTYAAKEEASKQLETLQKEAEKIADKKTDAETVEKEQIAIEEYNKQIADIEEYVDITETTEDDKTTYTATAGDKLKEELENEYFRKAEYSASVIANYDPADTTSTGAYKVEGQDAVITLNGAQFTSNSNVFEINGLTFTALAETQPGQSITVTTQNDTNGIYDMIKNFFKEYNAIINEMDKMYNADSAKGYEPLTNDEKDTMSDKDIEEWEKKIKDSLLRRDNNLFNVSSAMKEIMMSGATVDGKKMYLSDFGINTLSYFTAAENEKSAYHIDGDPDDKDTSANADKLKGLIASDPDKVVSFFTELSNNLYTKLSKLSSSVEGYRSYGSFYDDKKMKSDYTDYTSKIKELEEKLSDYEDKWYKKFGAMETALAKMQSNTNAVTSLLGGS